MQANLTDYKNSNSPYNYSAKSKKMRAITLSKKLKRPVSEDDIEVLFTLEDLKNDLSFLHQGLDNVTDEMLIDSFIYEIKSIHMKYQFYIRLCKERGLVSDYFE